jgi:hypothetical protein
MKKSDAKQILKYLDNLTDKFTTKKEYDELVEIMKLVEKELEK